MSKEKYAPSNDAESTPSNEAESTPPINSESTPPYDYINPIHYKKGDKEVWEMMVDIWGLDAYINHCEMCAFKYRMRLGDKPDQPIEQELKKAKWYEKKAKELRSKIQSNGSISNT